MSLLPSIKSLGKTHHMPEEMRHVQGSLLKVVSGFWLEACFYTINRTGGSLKKITFTYTISIVDREVKCKITFF